MRALDRKLFRDLRSLRAQVATTAILVACGVSLLISSWSAFHSLRDSRDRYYQDYAFADLFCEVKRAPLDVVRKLERIAGVGIVEPRIVMDGLVDLASSGSASGKGELAVGRFVAVPSGTQPALNRLFLREGRLPAEGAEVEVVLHEGFAKANGLRPGSSLSVLVQGQREFVKVVGIALSPEYVYALSPSAPLPDDRHFGILWMAKKPMERLARMAEAFNSVSIRAEHASAAELEGIKVQMDELLKPYGGRGAYGRDKQPSSSFVNDEIAQQKGTAIVTPMIFLGIAAFLIHIIAARLIALHRSQIATLKAIGYANSEVLFHYLKLILLMMLVGAILGIGLGAILGHLYAKMYEDFFRFPSLDFSLSLNATLIGLAAGVLPGIVGAWSSIQAAFRLPPAEAMRPPAPPNFHASFFERAGVEKKMGIRQRMVWRNLFFRPLRLSFTVLGLSTALGVMVASVAWNDIVRILLNNQFQRVQREDLSVSFLSPLPQSALQQLAGWKGILAVEGYRVVPVRIRFRNFKRELAITGWPEGATMRQRLDGELRSIPLPAEGILLSDFFRKSWGVAPGMPVELETLEGAPRTIRVVVAGFTQDLVGISASMGIDGLWDLLGEQPGFNLAALKIDPKEADQIYIRLKDSPQVATINFKEALYRGFEESFGGMIRVFTLVLTGFALAIAVGVIYNSVRVSFSERAWEMASLRVLGFSRWETFQMLLTEVGVQTLLSLIPGCILGFALTRFVMKGINTEIFGFPVVIEPSTYATGILVVLAAFALSAMAVHRMILKLSLAEALKARD